jgi:hypothetical protein
MKRNFVRFKYTSNPVFFSQSDPDYTLTVATYRTRIILMCCVSQLLALLTIFTFLGTTCDTIPYVGINHFTAHSDEGWVRQILSVRSARTEWGHLANPQLARHSYPFKNQ